MCSKDDWKEEYRELSEDYRFFVQVGWQSTLAVLAVDGLLVGAVFQGQNAHLVNAPVWLLPLLGAILTSIMAWQQNAWNNRWIDRIVLLKDYDVAHGFGRFSRIKKVSRHPLRGTAFLGLQVVVALALYVYVLCLSYQPWAFCY